MHPTTKAGSILLFLDDERDISDVTWVHYNEHDKAVIFRTVDTFVTATLKCLSRYEFITLSLDHDLQLFHDGVEHTGKTAINRIINVLIDIDASEWIDRITVIAHTQNCVGKANIEGIWNCFVRTR